MGQVPGAVNKYGVVGDGRVAAHMLQYFKLSGLAPVHWARKFTKLSVLESLGNCETILLLISDRAIDPFILANPFLKTKRLIHFSGALRSSLAEGWHPLMTFAQDVTNDIDFYRSIPFIGELGNTDFRVLFPFFENQTFCISPEKKSLYHSHCVMSGNFTTLLWQKFFTELETKFSIPKEAAMPYLEQIKTNLEFNAAKALSGPIARQDFATIRNNLSALENDSFAGIYQAFVKVFAKGALE